MSYRPSVIKRALLQFCRAAQGIVAHVCKGEKADEPVDLESLASLLYGIYGEEVIEKVDQVLEKSDTVEKAWRSEDHPRGKDGRFIPKGSTEARTTASDEVRKAIRGDRSSSPQKLMSHLSLLTVKQIRDLAREHGKKVPSAIKSNLMESLRALVGGAATPIVPYEASRAIVPYEEKPKQSASGDGTAANNEALAEVATQQPKGESDGGKQAKARRGRGSRGSERPELGRTDSGGVAGTGQQTPARTPRILVQREDFTEPVSVENIPEDLRPHLKEAQQVGVSKAIKAMDDYGGFLLADGTGVGKTRQILAVAGKYARDGKKVVIIVPSGVIKPNWQKGEFGGSYDEDGKTMGVNPQLHPGDRPLQPGQVAMTTYDRIGKLKGHVDADTVVIMDESHAIKNANSQRGKHGREINFNAGKVMYATATPADKPLHIAHLLRAGVFGGGDPDSKKFYGKAADTYRKLGLIEKEIYNRHTGQTIKKWEVDPRVGHAESMRRIAGLMDQMTKEGLMIQRSLSMDNVDAEVTRITLSEEAKRQVEEAFDRAMGGDVEADKKLKSQLREKIWQYRDTLRHINEDLRGIVEELPGYSRDMAPDLHKRRKAILEHVDKLENQLAQTNLRIIESQGNKAIAIMAMRRAQEPHKIPHVVKHVQEELAAGRAPIIFLNRVNDDAGDESEDDGIGVPDENTARQLVEALVAAGVSKDDIGELHGAATKTPDAQRRAMDQFNKGKKKLLISTLQSGGTGVNLDDTVGNRPRTVIMMTPPLSANDMVQAAGRVNRLSTKSPARFISLVSDHPVDQWNMTLLARKMGTLGAALGKSFDSLLGGDEIGGDEPKAEAFDWGSTLVRKPEPKPAATATSTATEPTKTPRLKTKKVSTSRGERHVFDFTPSSKEFWDAWRSHKDTLKGKYGLGIGKDPRTGEWTGSVWGSTPEEVEESILAMNEKFGIFANAAKKIRGEG